MGKEKGPQALEASRAFGRNLTRFRERAGLSQEGAADRAGRPGDAARSRRDRARDPDPAPQAPKPSPHHFSALTFYIGFRCI